MQELQKAGVTVRTEASVLAVEADSLALKVRIFLLLMKFLKVRIFLSRCAGTARTEASVLAVESTSLALKVFSLSLMKFYLPL